MPTSGRSNGPMCCAAAARRFRSRAVTSSSSGCATTLPENTPFDEVVRELLTANGSTFANPPANYYRIARRPAEPGRDDGPAVLRHPHAVRQVPQPPVRALDAGRLLQHGRLLRPGEAQDRRRTPGRKPKTTRLPRSSISRARRGDPAAHRQDDGAASSSAAAIADDPAEHRTAARSWPTWLTSPDNPFFAKSVVNRIWFHLMGKGHRRSGGRLPRLEPVGQRRTARRPGEGLRRAQVRHASTSSATIMNSRTYQLSAQTNEFNKDDNKYFSHAVTKLLTGRAAAGRHLRRDRGAGEVRRPAAGHAGRCSCRTARSTTRSSRRSASRPANWPASANAKATATWPRRCN